MTRDARDLSFRPATSVLLALTILMAARLALAIVVVPPWQAPDEPPHFLNVRLALDTPAGAAMPKENLALEAEIIRSMADHNWWASYGEAQPDPLPRDFSDPVLTVHVVRQGGTGWVYPQLGATWLRIWRPQTLLGQYSALRWLSAVLGILTLWCAWAGTRLLFGDGVALIAGVLIAVHPQFLLMATAVNPAIIVNLAGAVMWWQAARLVATDGRGAAVLLVAAAVIAIFAKRMAAPLLPAALLLAAVRLWTWLPWVRSAHPGSTARGVRWLACAAAAAVIIVTALALNPPASLVRNADEYAVALAERMSAGRSSGELGRLLHYWSEVVGSAAWDTTVEPGFVSRWHQGLIESFWLKAGWLRYAPPAGWYMVVYAATLAALAGVAAGLWRRGDHLARTGVCIAALFVTIQMAGVYLGFLRNGFPAQGQYLFPMEAPVMATLAWGAAQLAPRAAGSGVTAAVLVGLVALDAFAWALVIAPAYLRA